MSNDKLSKLKSAMDKPDGGVDLLHEYAAQQMLWDREAHWESHDAKLAAHAIEVWAARQHIAAAEKTAQAGEQTAVAIRELSTAIEKAGASSDRIQRMMLWLTVAIGVQALLQIADWCITKFWLH